MNTERLKSIRNVPDRHIEHATVHIAAETFAIAASFVVASDTVVPASFEDTRPYSSVPVRRH